MAVFRRRDGRPAPVGPQWSGGRRQPSFLPREECASAQGKKVGGAVAGTRPAGRQTSHPERPPGRLPGTVAPRDRRGSDRLRPRQSTLASRDPPRPNTRRPRPQPRRAACPNAGRRPWAHGRLARPAGTSSPGTRVAPASPTLVYGAESAMSEAIRASGALNRPRRNSGGTTASTASSFSLGSMRR